MAKSTLAKIKKMSGQEMFTHCFALLKEKKINLKQYLVLLEKWFELRGYHYNNITGFIKEKPVDIGVKKINNEWFIAVQKNPEWDDGWNGEEHFTSKNKAIHKYIPRRFNEYLEKCKKSRKEEIYTIKNWEEIYQFIDGGENA